MQEQRREFWQAAGKVEVMKNVTACGAATVARVPAKSELALQPGESFQFMRQGDSGQSGAELLGDPLPREVVDIGVKVCPGGS